MLGRDADLPSGIQKPKGYSLRGLAVIVVMLVGLVAWVLVVQALTRWFGVSYLSMQPVWALAPVGLLIILAARVGFVTVSSYRARGVVGDIPKKLDPGSGRLQAVGKNKMLAPLAKLGPLPDEAFEPIVLFAPRIWPMPTAGTVVLVVTAILVAGLIELLRRTTSLPLVRPNMFTVMVGIAAGFGVQMLVWPTYVRITPGRLDIMRFVLGGRKPTVTTINLRNARVLAHFKHSALLIKPDGVGGVTPAPAVEAGKAGSEWAVLNLGGVWRPTEVVHAVCRGAVSTAPAVPLPDDRLVG